MTTALSNFIDTRRFGTDPRTDDRSHIRDVHSRLEHHGVVVLAGFLLPSARRKILQEALALRSASHGVDHLENVYGDEPRTDLAPDHPLGFRGRNSFNIVGRDGIAKHSSISAMYNSNEVKEYISRILRMPALHRYQDKKGALDVTFMSAGQQLNWHFDQHEIFASLQLQLPEEGGTLEIVPNSKADAAANHPRIQRLLAGSRDEVMSVHVREGDVALVRGGHSLHRVTAVQGERCRVVALLCYDSSPGVSGGDRQRERRYG